MSNRPERTPSDKQWFVRTMVGLVIGVCVTLIVLTALVVSGAMTVAWS